MTGHVIVPPAPCPARIESLLGATYVEAPPVWLVTVADTGEAVSAHLSEHAARVWVACSDVRASDPMPDD